MTFADRIPLRMWAALAALAAVCFWHIPPSQAAGSGAPIAYLYCYSGSTPTSPASWAPCSAANPLQTTASGGGGGGAITMAAGAVASGAYSAGSYAAGALAAGAFAAGAGVDGWDLTQGAKADSVCGTATGTCSVVSLLKFLNASVTASIPAGTNLIGKVGIDQTTPGTTNGVQLPATQAGGVALGQALAAGSVPVVMTAAQVTTLTPPSNTGYATSANQGTDPCVTGAKTSIPISITTNTTTNILTGTSAKKIYVCQLLLTSAAADNVAVIQGTTGGTCGSSTLGLIGGVTAANGLNFAANGGVSLGNGGAQVLQTTVNNNDICLITSAATPLAGSMTYVVQ